MSLNTLIIKGLDKMQQQVRKTTPAAPSPLWERYSSDASNLVQWFDFSSGDLEANSRLLEAHQGPLDIKRVVWFIPEFDNAFWGGIHTILRFAAYMTAKHGVENCFVLFGNLSGEKIKASMVEAFPDLKDAEVLILRSESEMSSVKPADASICTLWTTAYYNLKFQNTKRKFYFIQDYEPLFYPAGSTYAQVEETYRFGFYGLANTISLKNIYEQQYGGKGISFSPAVDTSIFFPLKEKKPEGPYKVFFYARPGHPRNGFELGLAALRKLKSQMGDKVHIVTAGAGWDPKEIGLEGVVENLGLLTYRQTAELYRSCDVALSMMFTKHPSYIPLELMASGCLVVTNHNPATTWIMKDRENCMLSPASATVLSDTLREALGNAQLRREISKKAHDYITTRYSSWESELETVYQFMRNPDAQLPSSENKP